MNANQCLQVPANGKENNIVPDVDYIHLISILNLVFSIVKLSCSYEMENTT